MGFRCKKCNMYLMTDKQKCACNTKAFDEKKLSKKTKEVKEIKPIAKQSEKKKKQIKDRGSLQLLYKKIAKKRCTDKGDTICEYCLKPFNIQYDVINQLVCFAHILDKGDVLYSHLCMFTNNIALVCSETCHKKMDAEICTRKLKPILKKLIENGEKIDVSNLTQYE